MTEPTGPTTLDGLIKRSVSANPDSLALADAPNRSSFLFGEPIRLTWAQLDHTIDALATQLSELGADVGTPVGIQLPNSVELIASLLACARLGSIAVPFPIQHRAHELRYGVATASVAIMVTADRPDRPDQLEVMEALLAEFGGDTERPQLAVFGQGAPEGAAELTLTATTAALPAGTPTGADDVLTICWTSGTTGVPKGVPRTNAMWFASSAFQVEQLALTDAEKILCPFPVVNMAGIGGMLFPWAMTGSALILHQPLDLPVFLGQLQAEAITYTVAPPPLLNMLLANDDMLANVDLSNIRAISSGSAPLDPWMVAGWEERGIEIVNVFGSNEGAAMLSTRATVADPEQRARFFPVPDRLGIRVRLIDLGSGDEITEPGRPGELRFSGPTVFSGYLGSDGAEFDEQGFYRTGDIFEYAGEDRPPRLLQFVDRAKDIIIRGGMNISAAEVEALTSGMDAIVECAAVGYPDRDLGERVGLFVVPAPGSEPTLDSVISHLKDLEVASYKLPERIELLDALPRNPVGKVVKPELRAKWRQQ